jgi:glycosyltransferase involved in cell wall biosynthesis
VALLGKPDEPTDAIEEYCQYLSAALESNNFSLQIARVPWPQKGWNAALRELHHLNSAQPPDWFFIQYTALAWSQRGFPLRFLKVLRTLKKKKNARCAVVFHDAHPYEGARIVDRVRRAVQFHVMREAVRLSDLAICTIPPDKLSWLRDDPKLRSRAVFIPVGANLSAPEAAWRQPKSAPPDPPTVAVFSLSAGAVGQQEASDIAAAVRYAAEHVGKLRLVVLGRNAQIAESHLRQALATVPAEIAASGVLPAEEIVRRLGASDVLLFVRGSMSTRRGSAIAGIACGLPVIGCRGPETDATIENAGVVLVPPHDPAAFASALVRVLTDHAYRASLAERSRQAQAQIFSWQSIADKYRAALARLRP